MERVTYQNANYDSGNQSVLFRFYGEGDEEDVTILIDCGSGVNYEHQVVREGTHTVTLLTHAHVDHIETIGEASKYCDAILASGPTVSVIETLVEFNDDVVTLDDIDFLTNKLERVDEKWTHLNENIGVRPIPVGHAPGAVGYLIRFLSNDNWYHIFAAGDFTLHDVAGNPGFDPTFSGNVADYVSTKVKIRGETDVGELSIGTLQLNIVSRDDALADLEEGLSVITDRVVSGSPVLVATGSLAGVHLASALEAIRDEIGYEFGISLVGKIAAVYESLDLEIPGIVTKEVFDNPTEILRRGDVVFAGPEDGTRGSSKRLLREVNAEGDATIVQFRTSTDQSLSTPWATNYEFKYSLHPSAEEIDQVIESINPVHLVVNHTTNRELLERYREKGSEKKTFVWASWGEDEYTLFTDDVWMSPSWVNDQGLINAVEDIRAKQVATTPHRSTLPSLDNAELVLEREGLAGILGRVRGKEDPVMSSRALNNLDTFKVDAAVLEMTRLRQLNNGQAVDIDSFVVEATDEFIQEALSGSLPAKKACPPISESIEVRNDTPLETLIREQRGGQSTIEETTARLLAASLNLDSPDKVEIQTSRLAPRMGYIRSLIENPETEFQSPDEVIQSAMEEKLDY